MLNFQNYLVKIQFKLGANKLEVRPGMLQFMGSQKVRHDWATELNWTEPGSAQEYSTNRIWGQTLIEKRWKEIKQIMWLTTADMVVLFGKA